MVEGASYLSVYVAEMDEGVRSIKAQQISTQLLGECSRRNRTRRSSVRQSYKSLVDFLDIGDDNRVPGEFDSALKPFICAQGNLDVALENQHITLADLPEDILDRLFLSVPLECVILLGRTCRRLRRLCGSEPLWRRLCLRDFGEKTDIELWLNSCKSKSRPVDQESFVRADLASYRSVYWSLEHHQRLVGTWRELGCGPRGALYHFRWERGCVSGARLVGGREGTWAAPFHSFGGARGAAAAAARASFISDGICTVEELPAAADPPVLCPKAEAAASVAGNFGVALGSSPEGSFGHEFMLFMQGAVAPGRRKKKSPSRIARNTALATYHLALLDIAEPTAEKPYGGLWEGFMDAEGAAQVVSVDYCLRGGRLWIVATKLMGDALLGSGEVLWEAEARRWTSTGEPAWLPDPAAGGEGGQLQILAAHSGHVSAAQFGGGNGRLDGVLWHCEGGSLVFTWTVDEYRHAVTFTRLDLPALFGTT